MRISLNIPQGISLRRILVTRNLLLLIRPIRKFDFMRKEITPCQLMLQSKLRPQRPQPFSAPFISTIALEDLDDPIIVSVALEPLESVGGDFVLEVSLRNRRTDIV